MELNCDESCLFHGACSRICFGLNGKEKVREIFHYGDHHLRRDLPIGALTLVMSIQNFDEMERHFTIAEHLDPDGDRPANADADPVAEYLT